MKTAMQELIEWAKDKDMSDTMISPQDLLDVINPLLEKEKEQIINAWIATDNKLQRLAAEQYYNQTYNQKK